MSLINVNLPSDGTTADVADYNDPINTIVNEVNGNLDNSNIDASAAIAGSKLAGGSVGTTQISDNAVTASKVDWDSTGADAGIWWEEIGRTTLVSPGDSIAVTSLPARKYLKVIVTVYGGNLTTGIRFNSDSGNNYTRRNSVNGAADSTGTSESSIVVATAGNIDDDYIELEVMNISTKEKLVHFRSNGYSTAGAGTAPGRKEGVAKWVNTANAIEVIAAVNSGSGDFAIGSEVVVLGHN